MNRDPRATGAACFVVALIGAPAAGLFLRSLRGDGGLTAAHWLAWLASSELGAALWRTAWISAASAALAVAAACPLALLVARSRFPGRALLRVSAVGPALMSQTLAAIAWVVLADPGAGLLNLAARRSGLGSPLNVFTPCGLVLVTAAMCLPTAYLLAEALFGASSAELEDAARVCGAPAARAWLTVSLPEALPGLAAAGLLCFCEAAVMFSVQGVIALPANLQTVTTLVYTGLSLGLTDPGDAAALSLLLMLLTLGALAAQQVFSARAAASMRTRPGAPRPARLTGARAAAACGVALAAAAGLLVAPVATLAARSLSAWGAWNPGALTLDAYRRVLAEPELRRGLFHSLFLGAACAGACWWLAFPAARLVFRSSSPLRRGAHAAAVAPLGWSGLLLGAAFLVSFARTPLYGTLWLLLLALVARELPIAFKSAQAGLAGVPSELEAQAYVCGADGRTVARSILAPLTRAVRAAAAAAVFLAAFREIEASSLLAGHGYESFGYNVFGLLQAGRYQELGALAVIGSAASLAAAAPFLRELGAEAFTGGGS